MIENEEIPEAKAIPITPNTANVAIYGNQDAMDDFPVLKAFQQYVDSEQAKAHKRLMSVCFFFTMLIVVIIGVFLFVVMNMRNSAATDGSNEIQKHILEQTARMNDRLLQQLLANNNAPAPSPASVVVVGDNNKEKPSNKILDDKERELAQRESLLKQREFEEAKKELLARENALKEREAKLAAELLAKEKKISEENAKVQKEKEILEHRRRLYPEYFDENGNELTKPITKKKPADSNKQINELKSKDIEIARLKQEVEIAKLKAEIAKYKQDQKPQSEKATVPTDTDDDLAELDALLESSGVYGKKADSKEQVPLPDILELNLNDDDSSWTIPLK